MQRLKSVTLVEKRKPTPSSCGMIQVEGAIPKLELCQSPAGSRRNVHCECDVQPGGMALKCPNSVCIVSHGGGEAKADTTIRAAFRWKEQFQSLSASVSHSQGGGIPECVWRAARRFRSLPASKSRWWEAKAVTTPCGMQVEGAIPKLVLRQYVTRREAQCPMPWRAAWSVGFGQILAVSPSHAGGKAQAEYHSVRQCRWEEEFPKPVLRQKGIRRRTQSNVWAE